MILADTSVWIDFFRNVPSPEADRLGKALDGGEDVCLCGPVLTEILQGLSSDRAVREVKQTLSTLIYLPISREAFESAAALYRKARAHGKTVRNSIDCVIAACAIAHHVPLLQKDRDYLTISEYSTLRLVKA